MRETLTRFGTALVLAPLAVWMLVLGGWYWAGFLIIVATISVYEFLNIMEARGYSPHRNITFIVTAGLIAVAEAAGLEFAAALLTAGILGLLVAQLAAPRVGKDIPNVSVSVAGVTYVGWLVSHAVYLRQVDLGGIHSGVYAVLFALVANFFNDTGAYFVGRRFGRTKVAPSVSPSKTWEGLLGGVVVAGLGGLLIKWLWELGVEPIDHGYLFWWILGMIVGLVGFSGDLVESLVKRDADVKDSGSMLPGHGGFLDRIDGALFTVPFVYYALSLIERISS